MGRRPSTPRPRAAAPASSRAIRCMPSAATTSRRGSPRPATPSSSRPAATPTSSSGVTASRRSTSWAGSACGRCASSSRTTTRARRRAATSTPACPRCRSRMAASTSRSARTCCSSTAPSSTRRSTARRSARCAASPREVRIFPLLALDGSRSPFVDACVAEARAAGAEAEMVRVPYEFQRGGNEMLLTACWRSRCVERTSSEPRRPSARRSDPSPRLRCAALRSHSLRQGAAAA